MRIRQESLYVCQGRYVVHVLVECKALLVSRSKPTGQGRGEEIATIFALVNAGTCITLSMSYKCVLAQKHICRSLVPQLSPRQDTVSHEHCSSQVAASEPPPFMKGDDSSLSHSIVVTVACGDFHFEGRRFLSLSLMVSKQLC